MASTTRRRRFPESRSRSRRRRAARAGRSCTPTTRVFTEGRREIDEERSGSGTRCTSRCRCRRSTSISIDGPYYAVGAWQNRAFAVPPAMGVDYRIVNGYVYITVNPVTDPAKIGERAGVLPAPRGPLLRELGRAVRPVAGEDGEPDRRAPRDRGARACRSTSPTSSSSSDDRVASLRRAARRATAHAAARRADVAAPLRVPAARLRRLPDLLRVLQGHICPTSPTSTSRR